MPIIIWVALAGAVAYPLYRAGEGAYDGTKTAITGAAIGAGAYLAYRAYKGGAWKG
jgi:uncharacterized membrane protein YebE (DUF533 family)